jgi:Tfp pilus assembly protein PilF
LSLGALSCYSRAGENKRQQEFQQHIQKAQGYVREKRPDLAIPELEAASAINPEDVDTQGNLGVLLYFKGKVAEAIPHLRAAVEKQPSLSKIQGILGIAELRTQDFAQGRKDLEASFPLVEDKKFKVQIGLELVGLYTQSGDLEQGASLLEQLKKSAQDNPEVLYAAYRTYSDLSLESMLALSLAAPDSAQMHQLLAHEETKEGNTNGAIAQFRKAIAINTHLPGVHFELAELLNTAQDQVIRAEAQQEYRRALMENPQDEKAICGLAAIAALKGDAKQAYDQYSRAVALQPGDADAKLGLAKTLIDMDQTDKALALLEETVQLEPTNAIAHYRLGTLYRKIGRVEDAKREIELYKQYKETKEKLRALYKELLIQPKEIRTDAPDAK